MELMNRANLRKTQIRYWVHEKKKKKKIETLLLKKEKIEALCKLSQTQKLRYLP
jgi:hypothetical protein